MQKYNYRHFLINDQCGIETAIGIYQSVRINTIIGSSLEDLKKLKCQNVNKVSLCNKSITGKFYACKIAQLSGFITSLDRHSDIKVNGISLKYKAVKRVRPSDKITFGKITYTYCVEELKRAQNPIAPVKNIENYFRTR